MKKVSNWHSLGLQLDVPDYELEKVEDPHSLAEWKMSKVLSYWWNNCPPEERTWQTVAAALRNINHNNLARKLESYAEGKLAVRCWYVVYAKVHSFNEMVMFSSSQL